MPVRTPTAQEIQIAQSWTAYQQNPIGFMTDCLDVKKEHIWPKMTEVAESVRDNQLTIVHACHSVSKCQIVGSEVLTSKGFVKIEDIKRNDRVIDENGSFIKVTGISPIQRKSCYKIVFDDNSSITVSNDHLWAIHDYKARNRERSRVAGLKNWRYLWSTTKVVDVAWMSRNLVYRGQNNISIPIASPLRGNKRFTFPYTLGLWLGDGTRGTSSITIGDIDAPEIIANIESEGFVVREVPSQRQDNCRCYCIVGLKSRLRKIEVHVDKHIPTRMLWLSKRAKLRLLQGYMDADGYRLAHKHTAALGTTDKRLYDTVIPFIASLGVKVFTNTEYRTYNSNPLIVYKLNFSPTEFQPFSLRRKQLVLSKGHNCRKYSRMVMSIKGVGEHDAVCISVESQRGLYLCTKHLIPSHNTYLAGRLAVWFKSCFTPSTVITTAPSDNLVKNQLWKEIHAAFSGAKVPLGGKMTTLQWELKPSKHILDALAPEQKSQWEKNFALGFSTSPDTLTDHATKMQGFHNYWVLVILDEGCGIYKQIWKAVMQGLIINERCKVLAIGNPTDPTGEFHKACQQGSGWNVINISVTDTPNYQQDKEVIPGVAGRTYYNRMAKDYREDSNTFKIRVLGQFPAWLEGTFFGSRMAELEKDGHIGDYGWEQAVKVYTFADYGDIYTAILFVQFIQDTIRIISFYYDSTGVGVPGYCKVMDSKPYIYSKSQGHWAGPDLDPEHGSNRKSLATGKTIVDEFAQLGYGMSVVDRHPFNDGIEDIRSIFPKLRINERTCKDLVVAIKTYRLKKNEALSTDDKPAYFNEPVKDWTRHVVDALRHLARAYRWHLLVDDEYIGDITKVAAYHSSDEEQKSYDPMDWI